MTTVKGLTTINCLKRGLRIDTTARSNLLQLPTGLYTNVWKDLRGRVQETEQELGTHQHIESIIIKTRNAKRSEYKEKRYE